MLIGETLRAQLDVLRFPSLWENSNIANAQRKKESNKLTRKRRGESKARPEKEMREKQNNWTAWVAC